MTLPVIQILSGPTPTQKGASDAVTAGMSSAFSAVSTAADLAPFEREELLGFLTFRLGTVTMANARAETWFGRLFNRFSGQNPDYVELSGAHLKQTFEVLERTLPDVIVARGKYNLRADYVSEAVERLRADG